MRSLITAILFLVITVPHIAMGAGITPATDLYRDGIQASNSGRPIIALISAADCTYCEVLKSSVLVGMERDKRIILREINIDSTQDLVDFEGRNTDHQSFANKQGLTFTPTVLFLDGTGRALTEPIIGVANIDYYSFYLEKKIEQSREKLNKSLQ